jgi:predicted permease
MNWRRFLRRVERDRRAACDLAFYLETETEDNLARGMPLDEARAAAQRKLGNPGLIREEIYRMNTIAVLDSLRQDVVLAVRNLRHSAGFATAAVLTLTLGIGANAAIFSVFYDVLVRPLPYADPATLYSVGREIRNAPSGLSAAQEFAAWRTECHALAAVASWGDAEFNLTGQEGPERLQGANVTADFLRVLGVNPLLGGGFTAADGLPGAPAAALLSYELWQRRFAGDPSTLNRSVVMNAKVYRIAGVLPARFRFPADFQPAVMAVDQSPLRPVWGGPNIHLVNVIARARAGVTQAGLTADLSAVSARYHSQMPVYYWNPARPSRVIAQPLVEQLVGSRRAPLVALLGSVGVLLLLACVNVANLQLARSGVRQREIGMRAALGASRARLAQWLIAENLVLSGTAGLAGVVVAYALLAILQASHIALLEQPGTFEPGWVLWAVTLAMSLAVGILAGLLPAMAAAKIQLNEALKRGASAVLGGRRASVRPALVLVQVALALVLLMGSALLLRSLQMVLAVKWGFQQQGLLTVRLRLIESHYDTPDKERAFADALLERLTALPGVESAGLTSSLPLTGYGLGGTILFEGQPVPPFSQRPSAPILMVSPTYFTTMRTLVLAGREFSAADNQDTQPVAIVNATFAKRFFAAGYAVGKRIQLGGSREYVTIVGIATDIRHNGRETAADPQVFLLESQRPVNRVNVVVRTRTNPAALASDLRAAVRSIDKEQPIYDIETMEERIRQSGANRTVETWLLTSLGLVALALAAIGIYGVVSESVNQRTREIGLRMALGAQQADVLRMILQRSLLLTSAGIAVGAGAGWYLVRYLQSLLFGTPPRDAAAIGAASLLLVWTALAAAYFPARRAAHIDPVATLRCD